MSTWSPWLIICSLETIAIAVDAEGNSAYSRDAYEAHVRRLMSILEQEQQARLRVEDKLEEARVSVCVELCLIGVEVVTEVVLFNGRWWQGVVHMLLLGWYPG